MTNLKIARAGQAVELFINASFPGCPTLSFVVVGDGADLVSLPKIKVATDATKEEVLDLIAGAAVMFKRAFSAIAAEHGITSAEFNARFEGMWSHTCSDTKIIFDDPWEPTDQHGQN